MSINQLGEHEQLVWLSDSDIDALVYVIECALGSTPYKPVGEMTRERLSRLSGMLLEHRH